MAFRGITSILNLFSKGIHNFLTLKFVENKGRVLENLVFLALKRKGYSVKKALLAGIKELELKTGLILTWDEKRLEKHIITIH